MRYFACFRDLCYWSSCFMFGPHPGHFICLDLGCINDGLAWNLEHAVDVELMV